MPRQNQYNFYVYITTNIRHTVFYTGVCNSLSRRIWEHKNKKIQGFTSKYNTDKLVYYEHFDNISYAIEREKKLKKLSHRNKVLLINKFNSDWKDLFDNKHSY